MTTCAQCQTEFTKQRMGQKVCSPICASRLVREQKKMVQERAKLDRAMDKAKREGMKTIPQLIKEAQREFNAYVRTRDAGLPCISCGAPPPDLSGLHAGRDAGHYRSTGSASHLRFHEDNCHAQCVHCNQFRSGNAVDYRMGLIQRIGLARVEALEADNEPVKWEREALRQIRTIYRARVRDMKKERGQ